MANPDWTPDMIALTWTGVKGAQLAVGWFCG
eukprot:CAMPEP_0119110162 /NCGR_PEP_ID=MMETSP1180-20130426/27391_1 /TAXON_ID=3052 ORGANISM="Chlamydomonas cf sp, Strain CCMP681" /NCGR_SAMPLE_ID=MMETSP1180 /ASSEMBLY_ACC=CAM_ASM_000741 /LENGTH=30 /DNA_ID= /DNA_START= /DNA_END= /DNA_ORIENTATION=